MTATLRHYWFALLIGLSLFGVIAGWQFVVPAVNSWFMETTRSAGFVLSKLSISGAHRTTSKEILAVLDIDDGMPLLSIDLSEIQQRIETLPWVKHATIARIFPGDLTVEIEERKPFALWQYQGAIYLIDSDGVVITGQGLSEFSKLLRIVGETAPQVVAPLLSMLSSEPEIMAYIRTAVRVGERRWDLIFYNGVRVKLPEDIAVKYNSTEAWHKFAELERTQKLLEREVSVIDMRIPGRVAMRVTPAGHRMMEGKEWAT
ncbi:cell division protein FtsQ/DivIB [Kordiimonas pumila]|uniref:Cell division protein FtsQ n=1 Tax=Kordiimonas pumila TaxID=2161677 RepID=A0ABV7D7Q7_9PROT|nr:FtsQ-type POTRA domain-containing protein [Kordiimonas pumila]